MQISLVRNNSIYLIKFENFSVKLQNKINWTILILLKMNTITKFIFQLNDIQ